MPSINGKHTYFLYLVSLNFTIVLNLMPPIAIILMRNTTNINIPITLIPIMKPSEAVYMRL